jgi:hypothetical protein
MPFSVSDYWAIPRKLGPGYPLYSSYNTQAIATAGCRFYPYCHWIADILSISLR